MYALIMAGGSGTRFWPRSREDRSKQFLNIFGKQSLIQSTVSRFTSFISEDRVYIVARKDQAGEIANHVPEIPEDHVILEPEGKNTAPCICLGTLIIADKDPDAVVIASPADHLIQKEANFRKVIKAAGQIAEDTNGLVTIGIPPNRPATGYGYIQIADHFRKIQSVDSFKVRTFAEKPNFATAERFLKSGDFFWNSGIFIFKASVFLQAVEEYLPELFDSLKEVIGFLGEPDFDKVLQKVYCQIRSISIDYGIMEKAKNVYVVKGNFDWSDLGSWEQVYKMSVKDGNGNAVSGDAVVLDTRNSYVHASDGFVAVLGLEDVIVVQEAGVTLVCQRSRAEEVKRIVERLKRRKSDRYV